MVSRPIPNLIQQSKTTFHLYQLRPLILKTGLDHNPQLVSQLILSACSISVTIAKSIFCDIPIVPPLFSYNVLIRAFSKSSTPVESVKLFSQLQRVGLKPDNFTYPFVLKACGRCLLVGEGGVVQSGIVKTGLYSDKYIGNTLLRMYAAFGAIERARKVFDELTVRDVASWSSMIAASVACNFPSDAIMLFQSMKHANEKPNSVTLVSLLSACMRTLMVAADWTDARAMGQLAIAGHARALLEWHRFSRFCGHCGEKTVPTEAGRRKKCSNESCRKRIYPRVDPVVIMLVVDRENDRVLLSKQSKFVPRMWSSLAGFVEPGESLEEAVRRETWEETGIEVGEVLYHSSQPWPVGPNSMPCQLMVGFYAYAKSLMINVDNQELEDAQWHSREEIRKALTFAEYKKAQKTAAARVEQICKGVEKGQSLSADFNVESGELATMVVPGPFAIAHHLISSWAYQGVVDLTESGTKTSNVSV